MTPRTVLEYGRSAKMDRDSCGYESWVAQLLFLRDTLPRIWCASEEEYTFYLKGERAYQIGTHLSWNISLPVAEITHPTGRVVCVTRGNFYNWMVSVEASGDVTGKFERLFVHDDCVSACHCEGFPEDRVYGPYSESKQRFTVCLRDTYSVATFFYLLDQWAREE